MLKINGKGTVDKFDLIFQGMLRLEVLYDPI